MREYKQEFKPTSLYIKQHSITGKLYFGKTVNIDVNKYNGSGKDWKLHITEFGKQHVVTLWYEVFASRESIKEFATNFSIEMNIVESTQWLNLTIENGLGGGGKCSDEKKLKLSNALKGRVITSEARIKIGAAQKGISKGLRSLQHKENLKTAQTGKQYSEESKRKMSESRKNQVKIECPHCHIIGCPTNIKRYHFNNCKTFRE